MSDLRWPKVVPKISDEGCMTPFSRLFPELRIIRTSLGLVPERDNLPAQPWPQPSTNLRDEPFTSYLPSKVLEKAWKLLPLLILFFITTIHKIYCMLLCSGSLLGALPSSFPSLSFPHLPLSFPVTSSVTCQKWMPHKCLLGNHVESSW